MPLSELEANIAEVDFRIRAFLKEMLAYKKDGEEQLNNPYISPVYEQQLKDILDIYDQNINKIRFSGILL